MTRNTRMRDAEPPKTKRISYSWCLHSSDLQVPMTCEYVWSFALILERNLEIDNAFAHSKFRIVIGPQV